MPNPSEESKEGSYEDLLKAEHLKIHRITKDAIKAIQLGNELYNSRESIKHQFSQFATSPLTDPNKIPKSVSQEILESDYLQKKRYPVGLFEENKKKTAVNAMDLISYLLKQNMDLSLFSYGREFRETRLLKLHRILNVICQPYMLKSKFQWDASPPVTNPNEELIPQGTVLGFWDKKRSETGEEQQYLYYIAAPMDVDHINRNSVPEEDDVDSLEYSKKDMFLYGEIRADEFRISNLAQSMRDLKEKVKKSLLLTKEKCERDVRLYSDDLKNALIHLGSLFYPDLDKDSQEEGSSKSEKIIHTIKVLLPVINEEKISQFATLLWSGGFVFKEANINALLRFFHAFRYSG